MENEKAILDNFGVYLSSSFTKLDLPFSLDDIFYQYQNLTKLNDKSGYFIIRNIRVLEDIDNSTEEINFETGDKFLNQRVRMNITLEQYGTDSVFILSQIKKFMASTIGETLSIENGFHIREVSEVSDATDLHRRGINTDRALMNFVLDYNDTIKIDSGLLKIEHVEFDLIRKDSEVVIEKKEKIKNGN